MRERLRALAGGTVGDDVAGASEPEHAQLAGVPVPVVLRSAARPVAVAVGATALAAWLVLQVVGGPAPSPVEVVPGTPVATASPSAGPSIAVVVVVHVLGDVRRPGLVRLVPGSRVADALRAAGGVVPGRGIGGLNLARPVVDGEQIVVSPDTPSAPPAASPGTGGPGTAGVAVVDLNTATVADLDSLPGVGPVLAGRIVEWREANGRFASVDQLREVSGIGARTFERLAPHVRV